MGIYLREFRRNPLFDSSSSRVSSRVGLTVTVWPASPLSADTAWSDSGHERGAFTGRSALQNSGPRNNRSSFWRQIATRSGAWI